MHHDAAVRQRVPLALRAGGQQELAHRCRQPHGHGGHIIGDPLHGVVDRHAGVDRTTGAVDVQEDVRFGIFGVEQQHLRADRVGVLVAHLGTEEDDAVLQQRLIDVVGHADTGRGSRGRTRPGHAWKIALLIHAFDATRAARQNRSISPCVRCGHKCSPWVHASSPTAESALGIGQIGERPSGGLVTIRRCPRTCG